MSLQGAGPKHPWGGWLDTRESSAIHFNKTKANKVSDMLRPWAEAKDNAVGYRVSYGQEERPPGAFDCPACLGTGVLPGRVKECSCGQHNEFEYSQQGFPCPQCHGRKWIK